MFVWKCFRCFFLNSVSFLSLTLKDRGKNSLLFFLIKANYGTPGHFMRPIEISVVLFLKWTNTVNLYGSLVLVVLCQNKHPQKFHISSLTRLMKSSRHNFQTQFFMILSVPRIKSGRSSITKQKQSVRSLEIEIEIKIEILYWIHRQQTTCCTYIYNRLYSMI